MRVAAEMKKYEAATTEYLMNLEMTGASETTVKNYSSRLNSFYEHMLNNGFSMQGPCFTAVQSWRNELAERLKPRTVKQMLVELRIFFEWASDPERGEQRWYESNPVAKSLFPDTRKLEKRPYDSILSNEQVMLLWQNEPSRWARRGKWPRNYALVILMLTAELRNSEVLDLCVSDLDFENEEIMVRHGKGDKFRIVDFPLIAQTAIQLYLNSGERPSDLSDDDYLFGTRGDPSYGQANLKFKWKRGTRQWLSEVVRRHVLDVTGVDGVTSHDLRHLGARIDLNSGMSLTELQAKLGHEKATTTQIYSGRLMPGKRRKQMEHVISARDIQALKNMDAVHAAAI